MSRQKTRVARSTILKGAALSVIVLASVLVAIFVFHRRATAPVAPPGHEVLIDASSAKVAITIVGPKGFAELPLLAQAKGFLEEERINADIKRSESGGAGVVREVAAGKYQYGLIFDFSAAFGAFEKQPFFVLATLAHATLPMTFYARHDIKTVEDLKGKRIGVDGFASGHYFLSLFLERHGMSEADVTVVDMNRDYLQLALVDGKVDGIADGLAKVRSPPWTLKQGTEVNDLSEAAVCPVELNLIANRDLVQNDPDGVEKFVRAIVKAVKLWNEHRDEAVSAVASARGLVDASVRDVSEPLTFEASLYPSLITALETAGRWYEGSGRDKLKTGLPSYKDFISRDALREVSPETVKVGLSLKWH